MKKIDVFDSGGCCSTNVTDPKAKMNSIRFSAAANNLFVKGYDINRYSLLSHTEVFNSNEQVKTLMDADLNKLPITIVNGEVVKTKDFPSNEELAEWLNISVEEILKKQSVNIQIKGK
ncbi:hypothetical protein BSK63_17195 [Paenibacillus odorifer]|uniref:arsenic metallochaperone ArsD family protein n=1 Tax=Paenibacillus odorifer TaxID=189426 RepID=UPI00096E73B9|nr:arsenic metallochaperone ArsD family protein [Paenibacillus odorifer]OME30629.1 hypothetical protein BSK63_17195 [Paenibacillus odorifer]